jgi:hypothetical protein
VNGIVKSGQPSRLRRALWIAGASLFLAVVPQSAGFEARAQNTADDGLPPPPVPQSYKNIKERQQREADERNDPNSPERDAYNQFASSAQGLQNAAIDDLQAAVNAAKAAGALDPKDAEGRSAIARRAQARITDALNKFEGAARDAKRADRAAGDLRKIGITPDPIYDPNAAGEALDGLLEHVVVPRHYGPGPETEPDEELDESAAQREKAAIDELRQAVKDAQDAGALDPKNVNGRSAKARSARDHAINALRNFEAARRLARSAEQLRQSKATRFRENIPYGQSAPPPVVVPPYGYGMGGYGRPMRDEPPGIPDPWLWPR